MQEKETVLALNMPQYECHKVVQAARIVGITVLDDQAGAQLHLDLGKGKVTLVTASWYEKHKPSIGGYYVHYLDGYTSYSPAEAFESGYSIVSPDSGMSFGKAIKLMHNGYRVARRGWNGKGMFIFLVPGSRFLVNKPPLLGIYDEGTPINYQPHIDIRTAKGAIVPWFASQSDVLAIDWFLV